MLFNNLIDILDNKSILYLKEDKTLFIFIKKDDINDNNKPQLKSIIYELINIDLNDIINNNILFDKIKEIFLLNNIILKKYELYVNKI